MPYFRDQWALFHGAAPLCIPFAKGDAGKPLSFVTIENLLIETKDQLVYSTSMTLALQGFFIRAQAL